MSNASERNFPIYPLVGIGYPDYELIGGGSAVLPALYEAAVIAGEAVAEIAPKAATSLVDLLRPASGLISGARFPVANLKTGETLEAIVASGKDDTHLWSQLYTPARERIASMYYSLAPRVTEQDSIFMYGNPPVWKPHIYLDYMKIEPSFRGQGVKEALIGELRDHSQALGLNGRVKLFAMSEEGTVSAIPWFKAGFRPQPYDGIDVSRFDKISALLERVVASKTPISLDQGKIFDDMLMYLPEK